MNNFSMNHGSNPPPSPHHPRNPNAASTKPSHPLRRRRTGRNPVLEAKLRQMALPLAPLVQLTTGQVHPDFPSMLVNYWLLTGAQMDSLAEFYHQRIPCEWTRHYPCPITWGEALTLEEKRRKIGKFIGLRGVSSFLYVFKIFLISLLKREIPL